MVAMVNIRSILLHTVWMLAVAEVAPETYDYVIVGGGTAGSVLANRLSESGDLSILVLNVAGEPAKAYNSPVMISDEYIVKSNRSADDGLRAQIMQPGYSPMSAFSTAETGSSPARFLGGSTLVGLTLYLRDHPEALNWGKGWSWKELKPHFHRAESLAETCYGGNKSCGDYGTSGPYHISKEPAYTHPLTMDFIHAAKGSGFSETRELNTEHGSAVGIIPTSQHEDGSKVNAYAAYLRPAMARSNLKVYHSARADRLIMHKSRCAGVAYRDIAKGEDKTVFARKEVILSAGYIYSPRLLFLSGLAGKRELEKVGLPVVKDLPAVGKHLTSARFSPLAWHTQEPTLAQMVGAPISPTGASPVPAAYASTVQEAIARFRSETARKEQPHEERADVVVSFMPLYYAPRSAPLQFSLQGEPWPLSTNAYTLLVTLGETEANGSVSFPSGSPDVSPIVTHEPLTKRDLAVAKEAVAKAKEVGNTMGGSAVENGAGAADMFSAVYDGRGTCRMGTSTSDSVVDNKLRVHGIEGLRIVDGSVIPHASPYLAVPEVLALAERAAAIILEKGAKHHASAPTQEQVEHITMPKLLGVLGTKPTLMQIVELLADGPVKQPQEAIMMELQKEEALAPRLTKTMFFAVAALASLVFGVTAYKRIFSIDDSAGDADDKAGGSDPRLSSPLLSA